MSARALAAAIVALLCVAGAACGDGDGERAPDGSRSLDRGEKLGRIDRLPGGTPVPVDTRTLRAATCSDGTISLITSKETITASLDCARMLPASIIDGFIGKEIVISFEPRRLKVESAEAGTMEFPAESAHLLEADATP